MDDLYTVVFDESSLLFDCYPGGNDTFVFANRRIKRNEYERAQAIIRSRYGHFQQGGFLERPRSKLAAVRLQMVGGGFSPNTARSVAAQLADLFCSNREAIPFVRWDRISVNRECLHIPFEFSGSREVLQSIVWASGGEWQVELEMMRMSGARIERAVPLVLDNRECRCDVVIRPGLAQVLIDENEAPFSESRLAIFRHIVAVRKQLDLHSHPIVGIAWWKREQERLSIRPVSYYRGSDTCYNETASGTAAVALALALHDGRSRAVQSIMQPSGEEFRVRIQPGVSESCPSRVFLTGPVALRGELNSSYQAPQQQLETRIRLVQ